MDVEFLSDTARHEVESIGAALSTEDYIEYLQFIIYALQTNVGAANEDLLVAFLGTITNLRQTDT